MDPKIRASVNLVLITRPDSNKAIVQTLHEHWVLNFSLGQAARDADSEQARALAREHALLDFPMACGRGLGLGESGHKITFH